MPVIPQHTLSKLDYVFVAAYFKSKYAKKYGNDPFLKPLVDVFKSLEETGIKISTNEGPIKVYFILSNILGDNLGQSDVRRLLLNTHFIVELKMYNITF